MSLSVALVKKCPCCGASIPVAATTCTACGALMPAAPAPASGALSDDQARGALNADVLRVMQADGKIQALKFIRERTGFGLKQAKDYLEVLETGRDPGPVPALQARAGCGTAAALALVAVSAAALWRLFFA